MYSSIHTFSGTLVYLVISSSSVVRRCTSLFYLQWNVGSSPLVERWCIFLYLHRQWYEDVLLFSTSSGTLVVHLQWNVGVSCYIFIFSGTTLYFSFLPPVERW